MARHGFECQMDQMSSNCRWVSNNFKYDNIDSLLACEKQGGYFSYGKSVIEKALVEIRAQ